MKTIVIIISNQSMVYGENICGEDYRSIEAYFQECKSNGSNPHLENMTFEYYIRPIGKTRLKNETFKEYNGNHFIYGWFEGLIQSDNCPQWIYANQEPIDIEVKIYDNRRN